MLQKFLDSEFALRIATFAFEYRRRFFVGLICLLIVYFFVSLLSYSSLDPSWSHLSTQTDDITNIGGAGGAWIADMLYFLMGYGAWALLLWLSYEAFCAYQERVGAMMPVRFLAYVFMWVCLCVLLMGVFDDGGVIGYEFYTALSALLGSFGAMAFALVGMLLVGYLLVDNEQLFAKKQPTTKAQHLKPNTQSPTTKSSPPTPEPMVKAPIAPTPKTVRLKKNHLHSFLIESGIKAAIQKEQIQDQQPINPSTHEPQKQTDDQTDDNGDVLVSDTTDKAYADEPNTDLINKWLVSQPSVDSSQDKPYLSSIDSKATDGYDKQVFGGIDIDSLPTMDEQTITNEQTGAETQANKVLSDLPQISVSDTDDRTDTQIDKMPNIKVSDITVPNIRVSDTGASGKADDKDGADSQAHTVFAMPSTTLGTKPSTTKDDGQMTNAPKPDIHDDKTYQTQSYAMQTALYRQSLSPLPSLDLLDPSTNEDFGYSPAQLQQLSELLEIKLQEFNITGTVQNIIQGPIVTSFEVELAAGVRASRVTTITTDLARSLAVEGLRVVEVIPGKPYIGIEISNKSKQTIKLIDLLGSSDYQSDDKTIAMAVGKGVAGEPVIADLAKAPHMLVAGTTGSGKSVLVNSLILSMLLKYRPDELRLVIIDPKEVDFAFYADIPHLLTPIVTDIETDTLPVLSWCVAEMERRYQLMKALRVQKLTELNAKIHHANAQDAPLIDPLWQPSDHVSTTPPKLAPLPFIVIIADEYNDMVKQVGKPLEDAVVRIAQKARAAGIHIIIATQRPSVDVITGIIKSNIPSRVAMYLKNKVDSRTVIDSGGAETLLGNGDMLFVAPGSNQISRVHGAFVSQGEITRIAEAWRQRGDPDYVDLSQDNGEGYIQSDDTADPLYQEAVAFVVDSGKTSISAIQRKLSIGYNRAANIVDDMQARGILSPPDNSGKRTLLL